jgi:ankyrin repeat protein
MLLDHDSVLLEMTDTMGHTPLFVAVNRGRIDAVRFLLRCGANVHATAVDGVTTLMIACAWQENLEIVRMLIAAGANVKARDKWQRTALHHAARRGTLAFIRELILKHNANMFAVDEDGYTPFDEARCAGRTVGGNGLLEIYGNKLNEDHGHLALHELLNTAEYSFTEDNKFHPPLDPFRIILPLGKLTLVHLRTLLHSMDTELIRNRDDTGKLPIHIACRNNAPAGVLALILEHDRATLHIADYSGNLPLHECCRGAVDDSSVRFIVEQGGDDTLAARNHHGSLPLHILCGSTNPSLGTVQYFIQSFPRSVAARTNAGEYPFGIARESSTASRSVVFELVRANPNLVVP